MSGVLQSTPGDVDDCDDAIRRWVIGVGEQSDPHPGIVSASQGIYWSAYLVRIRLYPFVSSESAIDIGFRRSHGASDGAGH